MLKRLFSYVEKFYLKLSKGKGITSRLATLYSSKNVLATFDYVESYNLPEDIIALKAGIKENLGVII